MYLSHHDFDTDLAAYTLNEMYTGINAKKLNWKTTYLDGTKHLHEAKSDINRCFFSLSNKKNKNYDSMSTQLTTTQEVQVKGSLAEEVLEFLENEKEKQGSAYTNVITDEKERNYGDGKHAGIGELVLLIVTIAQDIAKDLFKDFLKEKLKG